MDALCKELNSKFHCHGVKFALWNKLPAIIVSNKLCDAVVTLNGAHVCEFTPKGGRPLLWMSKAGYFETGKPLRGGIPVCWPWFGGKIQPSHGFVRRKQWDVESIKAEADGSNTITLLTVSDGSVKEWPFKAECRLTLRAGAKLDVSVTTTNTDAKTIVYSGALHTYLPVSKITDVKVSGLEGASFTDTLNMTKHVQEGPISFGTEIDRIYYPTTAVCVIEDAGAGRRIRVEREGSHSSVVWNPWIEKSKKMPDYGDEEYWTMVCVESANAWDDSVTLAPGASATLRTIIYDI